VGVAVALTLKLELLQHTGSFKPRGASNKVLAAGAPSAGLVAASGGTHGLAVAHMARELGVPAEVFIPTSSSAVKVARLRTYGVQVTVTGDYYADAYAASQHRATQTGALVVHAYDQPEAVAVAVQGTVARELDHQLPGVDTVLVAVGGGGIAAWFTGHARIVAVKPDSSPPWPLRWKRAMASTCRWAASPPTPWARGASERSDSPPPKARRCSPCSSPTRRSSRRGNDSGTASEWRPKQAAPPPWPH